MLLAIIFPPLAVFLMYGFRGEFWLNLLLLIFFYVPSLVHAVWLVARR
ncbi:YqaE/Pmp3 family membrane protein [Ponticaulis sp.]